MDFTTAMFEAVQGDKESEDVGFTGKTKAYSDYKAAKICNYTQEMEQ